jgi:hypothetical protein
MAYVRAIRPAEARRYHTAPPCGATPESDFEDIPQPCVYGTLRRGSHLTDAASNQAAVERCEFVQSDERCGLQSGYPELGIAGFDGMVGIWISDLHAAGNECNDDVIATDAPDNEGGPDLLGREIRKGKLNQNEVATYEWSTRPQIASPSLAE